MKKTFSAFIVTLLALTVTLRSNAQPNLDPTFNGSGYVLTTINPADGDIARSTLVQPNGKILTGGNSFDSEGFSDIAIARFNSNGSYDNTFGTAGIVTIPGGFFCDMALLPNNKIIVAGGGLSSMNFDNYVVYRLNKDGSPDATFGKNGQVAISMSQGNMICFDVALQSDGKIVLGGYVDDGSGGNHQLLVVRLNSNGKLDSTFAKKGKFMLHLTDQNSECHQLAIQPDGKIVAGGFIDTVLLFSEVRDDFAAVRLNTNGKPDNTFGSKGIANIVHGTTDVSYATGLLSDGRIILAGTSDLGFSALCLSTNGTPDNNFGTGGWKGIDFFGEAATCEALVVDSDDDIIMGGDVIEFPNQVALAKIHSDGTMDRSFGADGVDTSFTSHNGLQGCNDVALQADNKIVIAGFISEGGSVYDFLTARFSNSAPKYSANAAADRITSLSVYPNPCSDVATVQYELGQTSDVVLQLIDLYGRIRFMWNQGNETEGSYTMQIPLADLEAGSYIILLKTDTGVKSIKVQKTN